MSNPARALCKVIKEEDCYRVYVKYLAGMCSDDYLPYSKSYKYRGNALKEAKRLCLLHWKWRLMEG